MPNNEINFRELSKEISYALRHAPWEYELEMEKDGSVPVEQLLDALGDKYGRRITVDDLEHIMNSGDKKRWEISGDTIRALYGHSVPMHIEKTPGTPPYTLYHGTAYRFLEAILQDGLKPMARQYVHMATDKEMAWQVGARHDSHAVPCILAIDTVKAAELGTNFFVGNEKVWLADTVHPDAIRILVD